LRALRGIIRHERWCITLDPLVYYAYEIVAEPGKLSIGDALILHALGVRWGANQCSGKCKTASKLTVAGPA
jgi:hypothetical protein